MKKRWKYRSERMTNGERFAVNSSNSGNSFNFWYITEDFVRLYTYKPQPQKYGKSDCWHDPLCRELLADLVSQNPSVEVLRYAVNGVNVYPIGATEKDWPIPKTPPLPEH